MLPACVTPVSVWKRGCYVLKAIDKKQGELYLKHSSVDWLFAFFILFWLYATYFNRKFYPSVALFVTCHVMGATHASAG